MDETADASDAMLGVLAPVHSERLEALRALQVELTAARHLACVLVASGGYPALSVARLDGRGSMTLGCAYLRVEGAWWYVARRPDGGAERLAPVRETIATARLVVAGMRRR
ncbi:MULTISPECIES: hypothetical protein [Actinomadura]|uniref:WYL domain-containing protein n=1 Tax=Actinomadura yumaensis TaxID=111807 RepID=A0ABW2CVR9_9ACTN|nr:hypothetical protein [Actinomadura sp. J1-007]MWK32634.1 hypothetical protein [Actinomadura sp. J1-007]